MSAPSISKIDKRDESLNISSIKGNKYHIGTAILNRKIFTKENPFRDTKNTLITNSNIDCELVGL